MHYSREGGLVSLVLGKDTTLKQHLIMGIFESNPCLHFFSLYLFITNQRVIHGRTYYIRIFFNLKYYYLPPLILSLSIKLLIEAFKTKMTINVLFGYQRLELVLKILSSRLVRDLSSSSQSSVRDIFFLFFSFGNRLFIDDSL